MWAYIKDNKIEQIYQRPKSLVLGEVRYPSNMFTKYTDDEKAAIGIYPVEDSGTKGNDKFEYTSQATYTWSASDKKVPGMYYMIYGDKDGRYTIHSDRMFGVNKSGRNIPSSRISQGRVSNKNTSKRKGGTKRKKLGNTKRKNTRK